LQIFFQGFLYIFFSLTGVYRYLVGNLTFQALPDLWTP